MELNDWLNLHYFLSQQWDLYIIGYEEFKIPTIKDILKIFKEEFHRYPTDRDKIPLIKIIRTLYGFRKDGLGNLYCIIGLKEAKETIEEMFDYIFKG